MPSHPFTLLCLSGSLRTPSFCLATCKAIQELAEASKFRVEIVASYRNADAMIWVSPTYHGTVSGVFKNMLDFAELLSRDEAPYFQGRPVGLISINDSTTFAAMRDCARELRAWLAPTHIELGADDFSSDHTLSSDVSQRRISRLIGELGTFVQAHRPG